MTPSALEQELRAAFGGFVQPVPAAATPAIGNEDDLRTYVEDRFGVRLPCVQVCPDHASPWDAFCDAYFARSPVAVWKASRGFGGKSFTLSLLSLVEALTLGADVNVLGGSGEQSQRVLEAMTKLWAAPGAPREALASDPAQRQTRLVAGNSVRALMASQASVRGPHPQRLRLDEIDEMDLAILDSAMGQPMSAHGVLSHTVLSSTHQYPDGTMSTVLRRAQEKNWRVFEWCWKETCDPHGWLAQSEIARKRAQVTDRMWHIEYDLQEPSAEGRAFLPESIARMFQPALGTEAGENGRYYEFEPPQPDGTYAHGADWAREHDWTVIPTLRIDVQPYRVVAFERLQRQPWPQMIQRLDERIARYGGSAVHDGTGLGNVIASLLTQPADAFHLIGRQRQELLAEYIKAVEEGLIDAPVIAPMFNEHKFASYNNVYGSGHLPDTICAMALAFRAAGGRGPGMGFLEYARQQVAAWKAGTSTSEPSSTPAPDSNPWLALLPTRECPD